MKSSVMSTPLEVCWGDASPASPPLCPRLLVAMACERSCSVTMFDRRVMSQYYSFVIMLGAGATRLT